jgi:hypothetical protein
MAAVAINRHAPSPDVAQQQLSADPRLRRKRVSRRAAIVAILPDSRLKCAAENS